MLNVTPVIAFRFNFSISPWPTQRGNAHERCGWFLLHQTTPLCPPGPLNPQFSSQSPQRTAAPSCNMKNGKPQNKSTMIHHIQYMVGFLQQTHFLPAKSNLNALSVGKMGYWLQQLLGFARRVIGSVSPVFLCLFIQSQQLGLQLAAESWQGVPDVVGKLL